MGNGRIFLFSNLVYWRGGGGGCGRVPVRKSAYLSMCVYACERALLVEKESESAREGWL